MTSPYRRQKPIAEILACFEMRHHLEVLGLENFATHERRILGRGPRRTRPLTLIDFLGTDAAASVSGAVVPTYGG